jgi:hypothetical protein
MGILVDLLVNLSILVIFYTICWTEPGAQNFPAYSARFYRAYPALNQAKISIIRFNMFTIVRESLGTPEPPRLGQDIAGQFSIF